MIKEESSLQKGKKETNEQNRKAVTDIPLELHNGQQCFVNSLQQFPSIAPDLLCKQMHNTVHVCLCVAFKITE